MARPRLTLRITRLRRACTRRNQQTTRAARLPTGRPLTGLRRRRNTTGIHPCRRNRTAAHKILGVPTVHHRQNSPIRAPIRRHSIVHHHQVTANTIRPARRHRASPSPRPRRIRSPAPRALRSVTAAPPAQLWMEVHRHRCRIQSRVATEHIPQTFGAHRAHLARLLRRGSLHRAQQTRPRQLPRRPHPIRQNQRARLRRPVRVTTLRRRTRPMRLLHRLLRPTLLVRMAPQAAHPTRPARQVHMDILARPALPGMVLARLPGPAKSAQIVPIALQAGLARQAFPAHLARSSTPTRGSPSPQASAHLLHPRHQNRILRASPMVHRRVSLIHQLLLPRCRRPRLAPRPDGARPLVTRRRVTGPLAARLPPRVLGRASPLSRLGAPPLLAARLRPRASTVASRSRPGAVRPPSPGLLAPSTVGRPPVRHPSRVHRHSRPLRPRPQPQARSMAQPSANTPTTRPQERLPHLLLGKASPLMGHLTARKPPTLHLRTGTAVTVTDNGPLPQATATRTRTTTLTHPVNRSCCPAPRLQHPRVPATPAVKVPTETHPLPLRYRRHHLRQRLRPRQPWLKPLFLPQSHP